LLLTLGEEPSEFDARGLRELVLEERRHCGWAKAQTLVSAGRAFIRFRIAEGKCPAGLDEAILGPAHWRLSTLPRYLQAEEVEKVIGACNSNTARLFLRFRAPLRGLGSHCAVSVIVAEAMPRAGLTLATRGAAHVLRHSAATTLLRQGASLQEIAAILWHRCLETTAIYAKVDLLLLKQVAQPWPEVEPC